MFYAFNKNEKSGQSTRLPGGVAIKATDQVAHRVSATGHDESGLGRWTWMSIQGKGNHLLRIVTGYRPCEAPGVSTTYQQQQRFFRSHSDNRDPRTAFYEDLFHQVNLWKQNGDNLIMGWMQTKIYELETQKHFLGQ